MPQDAARADMIVQAALITRPTLAEAGQAHGRYEFVCYGPDGQIKWQDTAENVVTTVGVNFMLDTLLEGAAYTAATFMGLTTGAGTVNITDTMASHAGWLEAGNANDPDYTAPRKTIAAADWAAASARSKAAAVQSFAMLNAGTVQGAFIVLGPSAVNTIDSTTGILYSVGNFAAPRTVSNGDTLSVTYSTTMT